MRQFDEYEKKFIELLGEIKLESNETFPKFLQDKYFTIKNNTALVVKHDTKDVLFYMSPEVFDNVTQRAWQIKQIWSLIGLIEYLDENRYIKSIPMTTYPNMQLMSQRFDDTVNISGDKLLLNKSGDYLLPNNPGQILNKNGEIVLKGILWNDLYEPITKKLLGIIYPSESIKYLIEHDFQTEEDYRFKKQYRQTWIGIGISFFLGLFSVIFSLTSSFSDDEFNDKQYRTIDSINQNSLNGNKAILLELDSIKNKIQPLSDSSKNTGHNIQEYERRVAPSDYSRLNYIPDKSYVLCDRFVIFERIKLLDNKEIWFSVKLLEK